MKGRGDDDVNPGGWLLAYIAVKRHMKSALTTMQDHKCSRESASLPCCTALPASVPGIWPSSFLQSFRGDYLSKVSLSLACNLQHITEISPSPRVVMGGSIGKLRESGCLGWETANALQQVLTCAAQGLEPGIFICKIQPLGVPSVRHWILIHES